MEASKSAVPAGQMSESAGLLLRRIRLTEARAGSMHVADRPREIMIRREMLRPVSISDYSRLAKNYRRLAISMSRALSKNYLNLTSGIGVENLPVLLANLSEHIMAELKHALELQIPMPAINLRRNSVDEILLVINELEKHENEGVRSAARKIVFDALRRTNLIYVLEILRTEFGQ